MRIIAPRLIKFDQDSVNIALEQLAKQVKIINEISPELLGQISVSTDSINEIIDELELIKENIDTKVDKSTIINSEIMDTETITINSDNIPFADEDISVTEKVLTLATPINITESVEHVADLPSNGAIIGRAIVVRSDENHNNEQWLYVWNYVNGVPQWIAIAPFGINLDLYYTKADLFNRDEIIEQNATQDANTANLVSTATTNILTATTQNLNMAINQERALTNISLQNNLLAANSFTDAQINILRSQVVPRTLSINGYSLTTDVLLDASDFKYVPSGRTVEEEIGLLNAIMNVKDVVDTLPPTANEGDAYIVDGQIWLWLNGRWNYVSDIDVNFENYYTKTETVAQINNIANNLINDNTALWQLADAQLAADIVAAQNNAVTISNNYTDLVMQPLIGATSNAVQKDFSFPLVENLSYLTGLNNITTRLYRRMLDGSVGTPVDVILPSVTETNAGLFAAGEYTTYLALKTTVDGLKVGGLFVGSFATYAALIAAPYQPWWSPNDWATVRVDETRQGNTTKYVLDNSMTWRFDYIINSDTVVSPFSMTAPGTILGSEIDGRVYPIDNQGRGAVYGWDNIWTNFTNVRTFIGADVNYNPLTSGLNGRITTVDARVDSTNTALTDKADRLNLSTTVAQRTNQNLITYNTDGQIISSSYAAPPSAIRIVNPNQTRFQLGVSNMNNASIVADVSYPSNANNAVRMYFVTMGKSFNAGGLLQEFVTPSWENIGTCSVTFTCMDQSWGYEVQAINAWPVDGSYTQIGGTQLMLFCYSFNSARAIGPGNFWSSGSASNASFNVNLFGRRMYSANNVTTARIRFDIAGTTGQTLTFTNPMEVAVFSV